MSPSPPFPLRVPVQGLSFDGFVSFLQCMSYPIPFPSLDLHGHLNLPCPSPKFFIWNHFGQWTFSTLRKQRLTKVCSFGVVELLGYSCPIVIWTTRWSGLSGSGLPRDHCITFTTPINETHKVHIYRYLVHVQITFTWNTSQCIVHLMNNQETWLPTTQLY